MKHLFGLHLNILRNKVVRLTLLDQFKAALFLLTGLGLLSAIYFGTWRLMSYLNGVAIVGPLLINKLLAMVFLTSFSMVAFSGIITSFTTIFSSRDIAWLMATPLPVRQIFSFKAFNTALYASWMVLVALFPFIIAVGQVKAVALSFYAGVVVLLVPFLALASMTGIVVSLLLMRFFPAHRTRDMMLFLGIVLITGIYILLRLLQPERLAKPDAMEIVAQYLSYLDAPTAVYLPSWWLTGGVYSLIAGASRDFFFYISLLIGGAVAAMMLVVALAERFFFVGWAEGQVYRRRAKSVSAAFRKREPFTALLEKDITIFFRDATQWTQLLLLGALIVVYLFSIYKLPLDTAYIQNLVSFFNVGLIGFVLAAIALRFVFPAVSLEGKSMWLLKSLPFSMKRLLTEKLVFGSIPVVILGLVLVAASGWLLKVDRPVFLMSLAAIAIMAAGFNCMAAGFGSIFPVFDYTSVAQIESSPGGLFYIVTAFFYLGINVALWASPLQNYYQYKLGGACFPWRCFWWAGAGLFVVNMIAVVLPLWRGVASLEALEQ
jgi:ABC-2 type transport system permease protein